MKITFGGTKSCTGRGEFTDSYGQRCIIQPSSSAEEPKIHLGASEQRQRLALVMAVVAIVMVDGFCALAGLMVAQSDEVNLVGTAKRYGNDGWVKAVDRDHHIVTLTKQFDRNLP